MKIVTHSVSVRYGLSYLDGHEQSVSDEADAAVHDFLCDMLEVMDFVQTILEDEITKLED